jgi:hypothetical protein
MSTLFDVQYFDEAYGISRSLVECAATLRYLTLDLDKERRGRRSYLDYFKPEKMYWLHQARSYGTDPQRLKDIEQYASKKKLKILVSVPNRR